jgi:hypothetical protein
MEYPMIITQDDGIKKIRLIKNTESDYVFETIEDVPTVFKYEIGKYSLFNNISHFMATIKSEYDPDIYIKSDSSHPERAVMIYRNVSLETSIIFSVGGKIENWGIAHDDYIVDSIKMFLNPVTYGISHYTEN